MSDIDLKPSLTGLGLHYLASSFQDFVARASKKQLSPQQIIEEVIRQEMAERKKRSLARRISAAKLGRYREISDFDWNWPSQISRSQVENLMTLGFVEEPANVILVGPSGVGKTMIAKNLAYQSILAGHSALFVEASDLLSDLESQETPRALKARLARYLKPQILVIDEVGYLSYSVRASDLMFQVFSKRYEKTATVVTTNVAFKDWNTIFPAAAGVVAMVDRLTHRAEIVTITAESYRKKEAIARRTKAAKKPSHTKAAPISKEINDA